MPRQAAASAHAIPIIHRCGNMPGRALVTSILPKWPASPEAVQLTQVEKVSHSFADVRLPSIADIEGRLGNRKGKLRSIVTLRCQANVAARPSWKPSDPM